MEQRVIPNCGKGEYVATDTGLIINMNTGNILKQHIGKQFGYLRVTVTENGQRVTKLVHRLIASAFIPNPENKEWVEHINGDILDNRLENLRWSTQEERIAHAPYCENGVMAAKQVREKAIAQCDAKDHDKIIQTFSSSSEAAHIVCGDVSKNSLITRCANGKKPTAYGFFWKWVA